MTAFDKAFAATLQHEGGFVDDPDDPGGATKFGVSFRWLKSKGIDIDGDGDVDADDIVALDLEGSKQIYLDNWWLRYRYDEIHVDEVAAKIFDLCVNMGPHQAHKLAQSAANSFGKDLVVDGILGSKSIAAINCIYSLSYLNALKQQATNFYLDLIKRRPVLAKYKNGWLKRAAA